MSYTYETEQATLKERVKVLKAEIEKAKAQDDKILDFMMLIACLRSDGVERSTPYVSVFLLFINVVYVL